MWRLPGPCGLLALLALLAVESTSAAEGGDPSTVYSIQVQAVPLAEAEDGMATYRDLRDKSYLAYAYRVEINGEPWLRIAVGAFHSHGAAAEFGRAFGVAEGMDHFVAAAPVRVLPGAGERDFVVTPSALWVRGGAGVREVYAFDAEGPNGAGLPADVLPDLAPDGRMLAFAHGCRLNFAPVEADAAVITTDSSDGPCTPYEGELPWQLDWSASGEHAFFLDVPYSEYPVSLVMARLDSGEVRCLICNEGGDRAVRWFVAHSSEDRVFFVGAQAYGMAISGSGLFSTNMDGVVRALAAPGEHEEIVGPLSIEDGYLRYRRLRWLDFANSWDSEVTDERIPLDAL